MAITIKRRSVLEEVGLESPQRKYPLAQGQKVVITANRLASPPARWAKGGEGFVIRKFPYRGLYDTPADDLYEVQLTAKDSPRLYFTFKELEVV